MATANKNVVEKEVTVPNVDKITYSVRRLVFDDKVGKYSETVGALTIPASFKITFGPPVIKSMGPQGDRGSLLRIYDGKLQRGVIPNVMSWFASDLIGVDFAELKLKEVGTVVDTF